MLVGNGTYLNKNAGRLFGGGAAPISQGNYQKVGAWRGVALQEMTTSAKKLIGYPTGYSGEGWMMPITGGDLTSLYNTDFSFTPTGAMLEGRALETTPPEPQFGFTLTGTGGLISTVEAGGAPATFGFATNTPILTASLGGTGSATFGFTTNTPILGALGGMTVTASFGMTAAWTAYAIGIMEGTTAEAGVTVDNIVSGVWTALLADYADTGNAALALQTAGSGGVDYAALWASMPDPLKAELAAYVLAAAVDDPIHADAQLMNANEIIGTGVEGDAWRGVGVPP